MTLEPSSKRKLIFSFALRATRGLKYCYLVVVVVVVVEVEVEVEENKEEGSKTRKSI